MCINYFRLSANQKVMRIDWFVDALKARLELKAWETMYVHVYTCLNKTCIHIYDMSIYMYVYLSV